MTHPKKSIRGIRPIRAIRVKAFWYLSTSLMF